MRRAEISEPEFAAVRARCVDLGLPVRLHTDDQGEAVIKIGTQVFDELAAAAAHVRFLSRIAIRAQT